MNEVSGIIPQPGCCSRARALMPATTLTATAMYAVSEGDFRTGVTWPRVDAHGNLQSLIALIMGTEGLGIWISAGAAIVGVGVPIILTERLPLWATVTGWSMTGAGGAVVTTAIYVWLHSNRDNIIRRTGRRIVSNVRFTWLIPVEKAASRIYEATHAADLWAGPSEMLNDEQRVAHHIHRLQHDARFSFISMYGRRTPEGLFARIPPVIHALSSIQLCAESSCLTEDGLSSAFRISGGET
jgi:hypothetical protein